MAKVCFECFREIDSDFAMCPHCGNPTAPAQINYKILQPGSVIGKKYLLGHIRGEGGFGITYVAYDTMLKSKVAIKEYFPDGFATRDIRQNGLDVCVVEGKENQYSKGLQQYIKEAEVLAELFNLPGIVCVRDSFYENNTAYIVMEYIDGISLKQCIAMSGGKIDCDYMLSVMEPIMSSLQTVHSHQLLHRDISPDNIMISRAGQVKLIDFGAARDYGNRQETQAAIMLKHGYAPIEQYGYSLSQGTYTDVYELCATMYKALTGETPPKAVERLSNDTLKRVNRHRGVKVPKYVEAAIMRGLEVRPEDRYQTVAELYDVLFLSRKRSQQQVASVISLVGGIALVFALIGAGVWVGLTLTGNGDGRESVREYDSTKADSEEDDSTEVAVADESEVTEEIALLDVQSDETEAIKVIRDGLFYDYSTQYTVDDIFNAYYDIGVWKETGQNADGTSVTYTGQKGNNVYRYYFTVRNDGFEINNISENGNLLANMASYFEEVLKSVGIY